MQNFENSSALPGVVVRSRRSQTLKIFRSVFASGSSLAGYIVVDPRVGLQTVHPPSRVLKVFRKKVCKVCLLRI